VESGGYPPIVGGYLSAIIALSWTSGAFLTAGAARERAARAILWGTALSAAGMGVTGLALIARSFAAVGLAQVLVGGGIGIAWAHLGNLMMAHGKETERDLSGAFISTNQLIAQAFASAFAGTVANVAGFAAAAPGSTAIVGAVACVFLTLGLVAAAAIPAAATALRLAAAAQPGTRRKAP
jgi:hypothetical protein